MLVYNRISSDIKIDPNDPTYHQLIAQPLYGITQKQAEVLLWIARGKTNEEIAIILGICTASVKLRVSNARRTLKVSNTYQLISKSFLLGILGLAAARTTQPLTGSESLSI